MKNFTTLIAILLFCVASVFAQAPEQFTYQAVVRTASNSLVANTQVGLRVNILQGSAAGNIVYSESHVTITNANGLLTVNIGGGNVLYGNFEEIDWSDSPYFLKTDIDPNGGSDYTITTTQQMLSVPYALYAKKAGNSFSGDYNDLENLPQIPQIPSNVSAFDNDAGYITDYTEQQVLSISNDTIFLTGGSFVKLPEMLTPEQVSNMIAQYSQTIYQYVDSSAVVIFQGYINQLTSEVMRQYLDSVAAAAAMQYIDSIYNIPGQHVSHDSTFSTGPCPEAPYLLDWDGNVYNTVKIGTQCWMKENLRTWHYADGTLIPNHNTNTDTPNRHAPGGDVANVPKYGYLYNWSAVMNGSDGSNTIPSGVQGVCPTGWHVPSKGEWEALVDYMGNYSQYLCSDISDYIAKSLASNDSVWANASHWTQCNPGYDLQSNNSSGFSALPAGNGTHDDWWNATSGQYAYFATSTDRYNDWNEHLADVLCISYYDPYVSFTGLATTYASGYYQSVRCLRD